VAERPGHRLYRLAGDGEIAHVPGSVRIGSPDFLCAVGALAAWTAYAVHNARWLGPLEHVSAHDWNLLTGVVTGALALFLVPVALLTDTTVPTTRQAWMRFAGISTGIAVFASILGNGLWNRMSRLLPLTLVGQMILFETLFALLYGFLWEHRLPTRRGRPRGDRTGHQRAALRPCTPTARRITESGLAGGDVHADGDDEDVEEKCDGAMHQADATQIARGDLHVGDLEGHADGEREVREVPVIGILVTRKIQSFVLLAEVTVIAMGVVQARTRCS
jgi:hypothetical protein